jgi:hypothetical protein
VIRRRSDLPPADLQPWSELISADSFYARLARWRDVLVNDEDYASLYKDSPRGRDRPTASSAPCKGSFRHFRAG